VASIAPVLANVRFTISLLICGVSFSVHYPFSPFDAGSSNFSAYSYILASLRSIGPPVLWPQRTVVLCVPLELSYRRQHAPPVVTMAHGPGDPYARVGSVARRVSSADGRRLRSRRRALSFFTGAAIPRLKRILSLAGPTISRASWKTPSRNASGPSRSTRILAILTTTLAPT